MSQEVADVDSWLWADWTRWLLYLGLICLGFHLLDRVLSRGEPPLPPPWAKSMGTRGTVHGPVVLPPSPSRKPARVEWSPHPFLATYGRPKGRCSVCGFPRDEGRHP